MTQSRFQLPDALQSQLGEHHSCIYICTAQPKWLLFAKDSTWPLFVIQKGGSESLKIVYETTLLLSADMPDRIAAPLALLPQGDNKSLLVQQGLPGTPWFSVNLRVRHLTGWREVSHIALQTLQDFHSAVGGHSQWRKQIDLTALFDRLCDKVRDLSNPELSLEESLLLPWRQALQKLGSVSCNAQHGDFCINNLLIHKNSAAIVDFEQFAENFTPLHDEFMLCGSLLDYHPAPDSSTDHAMWNQIVSGSLHRDLGDGVNVRPLFLLHLLWWVLETHGNAQRQRRAQAYRSTLTHILSQSPNTQWEPRLTTLASEQ